VKQLLSEPEVGLSSATMILYSTVAAAPPDGQSPSLPSTIGQANSWTIEPPANRAADQLPMLVAPRLSPPIELIYDGGEAPQLTTLKETLSRQSGIPTEFVGVAKWFGTARLWRVIHAVTHPYSYLYQLLVIVGSYMTYL
jgi:hypothetical protein